MTNYKRSTVVFNLDNLLHKELFEWCKEQSGDNFSDFARSVLLLYKQSKMFGIMQSIPANDFNLGNADSEAMADLL